MLEVASLPHINLLELHSLHLRTWPPLVLLSQRGLLIGKQGWILECSKRPRIASIGTRAVPCERLPSKSV